MLTIYKELSKSIHGLHDQVRQCIEAFPPEALDWTPGKEMNTPTVIITHLTGAERFLVGDIVMQDPSNRDRQAEFLARGSNKEELLHRVDVSEAYLDSALEKLSLADLDVMQLHPHRGDQVTVSWALLHTLEHTANHLGHLQLTLQIWQQRVGGQ